MRVKLSALHFERRASLTDERVATSLRVHNLGAGILPLELCRIVRHRVAILRDASPSLNLEGGEGVDVTLQTIP